METNNLYNDPISELRRKYTGKPVEDAIRDAKLLKKQMIEKVSGEAAVTLGHMDEMIKHVYSPADNKKYKHEVYGLSNGGEILENYRKELEAMSNEKLAKEVENVLGIDYDVETEREDYIESLMDNYTKSLRSRGELANGGEIPALPSSYFKTMNLSALPVKAQEYIKNEILTDNDIDLLQEGDEDYVSVRNLISETFPDAFPQPKPTEPEPETAPAPQNLSVEDYKSALDGAEAQLEFSEGEEKKSLQDFVDGLKVMLEGMMIAGGEVRSIKSDKQRKAKPEGWRFRGDKPRDYKRPSKADIKDGENVYFEGRKNRSDKNIKKKLKRGGAVNNFTDYYLAVNLDERGEYSASVYGPNDKSIFEIESAEQVKEMQVDGFLKYKPDEDLNRLTKYLMELNIIPNGSQIYSQDDFESKIREQYEGEMKRGGRIPSALAREKKYTSEQEHEQQYRKNRVSRVKYYKTNKAKRGGEMPAGANKWREHLAQFRKANPELIMKDAMKGAAKTYAK